MATPYLQFRHDEVASTQDTARDQLAELPVVVIARRQSAGRGRSGAGWLNAPRALAVSLAFHAGEGEFRPLSLMAGVAAARAVGSLSLKWPNDLMIGESKVGGILVERSDSTTAVGVGVNLWWPERPDGFAQVYEDDPGPEAHAELAGLWAAEMMGLLDGDDWPLAEYRSMCVTVGRAITWEPDGKGTAVDVDPGGGLVVVSAGDRKTLISGEIRHVRG